MAAQDVVYIFNTGVLIMNHFDITENISTTDQILRTFAGTLLLLTAITATIPDVHPSVFPSIAAYLVLTAIMKWDPIGYVIDVVLRIFGHTDEPTPVLTAKSILRTSR